MKIAVYYNLPFSGAKRAVFEQVKGLKDLGHKIDVYTINKEEDFFDPGLISDKNYTYEYKQKTINLPFVKKITKDLSDYFLLRNLHKKIANDIDKNNYDLVLAQTDHYTQAPYVLRFLKTKKIYVCLEPLKIAYEYGLRIPDNFPIPNKIYETINRAIRKKIDRDNARSSDLTFAISNFGRELMIQAFDLYPKVFYLGVDTKKFRKKKIKKKNQILFIGQKLDMNGYKYAQDAVKQIPKEIRPELKILSLGKKEERISDEEIVDLYNESLLTLSLSNYDTFGLVPLESMACGVPVIAFNVAAYRETIINNETGFLVDFNASQITEKIIYLLKNEGIREEMGKKGKELMEKEWNWVKRYNEFEKIIKEFIVQ